MRAQRRHPIVPSVAPYRRARPILPCRPRLGVLQPCLRRASALLGQSREERVLPPSLGPHCTERAWGLVPASQARHRRLALFSVALYQRARCILPCRPTLAVLRPCLQRTPALLWQSSEERV